MRLTTLVVCVFALLRPPPGVSAELSCCARVLGSRGFSLGPSHGLPATGGYATLKGDYVVHKFTSSGVFEVLDASGLTQLEVLVVAGGGGGGTSLGSGGGGGGVLHSNQSLTLQAQQYAVTVGLGGAYAEVRTVAANGGDSSFGDLLVAKGGAGGKGQSFAWDNKNYIYPAGGSGAGGCRHSNPGTSGTSEQGHNGGAGSDSLNYRYGAGGGGGAGGPGGATTATHGGDGGVGKAFDISGTMTYYAGGGGGGISYGAGGEDDYNGGKGGLGGGGDASRSFYAKGVPGLPNTGGGGGGGSPSVASLPGGSGGSGIVIVRYHAGCQSDCAP